MSEIIRATIPKNFEVFKGLKLARGVRDAENINRILSSLNGPLNENISLEDFEKLTSFLGDELRKIFEDPSLLSDDEGNQFEFSTTFDPNLDKFKGVKIDCEIRNRTRLQIIGLTNGYGHNPRLNPKNEKLNDQQGEVVLIFVSLLQMLERKGIFSIFGDENARKEATRETASKLKTLLEELNKKS